MIGRKKLIGVCLTKIYEDSVTEYADRLKVYAAMHDCKLIFFNSFTDFYETSADTNKAYSIYNIINYDMLDGIIILYDSFYSSETPDRIIDAAQKSGTPVLVVNGQRADCCCISGDYTEEYKRLIRHVIKDHGITDTVYMAGFIGEVNSERRINCYKSVMDECNIPINDDNIIHGDYWETPAKDAMERLRKQNRIPKAIFCANDLMALAVCEWLAQHDYRVPEDVIVTGFDGLIAGDFSTPSITTCMQDWDKIAKASIEMISCAAEGKTFETALPEIFSSRLRESCGCKNDTQDFRHTAQQLFTKLHGMQTHENYVNKSYTNMLNIHDMESLRSLLPVYTLEGSYVCVNRRLIRDYLDDNDPAAFSDEMMIINSAFSRGSDISENKTITLKEMVPNLEIWAENDSAYILSAIIAANRICGLYCVKAEDISDVAHKIKRVDIIISNCFNALFNNVRQIQMRNNIANAAMIDPVTSLFNLKGITNWFNEFSDIPESHKKTIAVSMYALPKYKYIYENYGIMESEKCLRFVAESLKKATAHNGVIAHISEDSFIVINIVEEGDNISDIVNKTTSIFFGLMSQLNSNSPYYLEVNAGCTVVNPEWEGRLSNFVKLANIELYINRIRYSGSAAPVGDPAKAKKDFTENFNMLLERNLFNYYFQPIVDARTGDIFAYEALMRTTPEIGMNPMEVLETAEKQNRLYEIERATMFNVMDRYSNDPEGFKDRHVFINSIPGHFLTEADNSILGSKYNEHLKNVVLEITEQNTISDAELDTMKHIGNSDVPVPIAVDDYGTGHSNIVNLMRYSPQIVKIDRFLITDVDKDQNKQMFIKSTIEFARMNDMKVLAEGVETSEELSTVVSYGVEYVQGYYTGKPAPEPLDCIKDSIRAEIIAAQPETV
ncbi:MAG: EAL domain-containing protein [Huintestinicola sp.]